MQIRSVTPYFNYQNTTTRPVAPSARPMVNRAAVADTVSFGAAKDLNLRYIMQKREHLLPKSVKNVVEAELARAQGQNISMLPTLKEVHNIVYAPLFSAKTLEEARLNCPDFADVRDFTEIARDFPRSTKMISEHLPIEEFSLDCLKKIWSGMPQEEVAKSYGFSGRGVLAKICQRLNIPKPEGNYLVLLKTCEEEGNSKVAEISRCYIKTSMKNLKRANKANKTAKARAKQAESMRRFYIENPDRRREVSEISRLTWEKCPEIRKAQVEMLSDEPAYVQIATGKQCHGCAISANESRSIKTFYKKFWEKYPEFREAYARARREATAEVRSSKK